MPRDMAGFVEPVVHMFSGAQVSMINPEEKSIEAGDLVRSLSMMSHYVSGTLHFYSSAQHSVIASYLAEDMYGADIARACLWSRSTNVIVGKFNPGLDDLVPGLADLIKDSGRAVYRSVGIDEALWNCDEVREVAAIVTASEYRDLKPNSEPPAHLPQADDDLIIAPMTQAEAHEAFKQRVAELHGPDLLKSSPIVADLTGLL